MTAATLLLLATSCASSSRMRQKPSDSSGQRGPRPSSLAEHQDSSSQG